MVKNILLNILLFSLILGCTAKTTTDIDSSSIETDNVEFTIEEQVEETMILGGEGSSEEDVIVISEPKQQGESLPENEEVSEPKKEENSPKNVEVSEPKKEENSPENVEISKPKKEESLPEKVEVSEPKQSIAPLQEAKKKNKVNSSPNDAPIQDATKEKQPSKQKNNLEETKLVGLIDRQLPSKNSRPRSKEPTHVMIHFMSNVINKPKDPYNIQDIYSIFTGYGVSAHYVIGRSGEIYFFVPEDRVAFHAGKGNLANFPGYKDKLNDYSIGIELLAIGTQEEMLTMMSGQAYDALDPSLIGYTDAQYKALNNLLDDILIRHPSISKTRKHVVGHDEYAPGRKTDPGSLFDWSRLGL